MLLSKEAQNEIGADRGLISHKDVACVGHEMESRSWNASCKNSAVSGRHQAVLFAMHYQCGYTNAGQPAIGTPQQYPRKLVYEAAITPLATRTNFEILLNACGRRGVCIEHRDEGSLPLDRAGPEPIDASRAAAEIRPFGEQSAVRCATE